MAARTKCKGPDAPSKAPRRKERSRAAPYKPPTPYRKSTWPNSELKFFDTTRASHVPAAAGTISNPSLNLIVQGFDENDRIGRKCVIKGLFIKGTVFLASTTAAASTSDRLRVIVYLDKQSNGATATVTDILETAIIDSFRNLANSGRFQILSDVTEPITIPGGGAPTGAESFGEIFQNFSCSKANLNIPVEFDGASGAITDITSNNFGVLAISQSATCNLNYIARVRFSE